MDLQTNSEQETIAAAQDFAAILQSGDIVAFYGDLGAGKSVFCRALIRTLTETPDLTVPSPTFSLLQTYELPSGGEIWHFDFYRLKDPEELFELGWEDALAGPIVLIEWPERIEGALPAHTRKLMIKDLGGGQRRIHSL